MKSRKTYTVNYPGGINLRAEPSMAGRILAVLPYGEKVKPQSAQTPEGWMAVDGGYVMKEYIEVR